ncbi:transposase IS4 family protein [Candidatus Brocadia pituitae]|nr:transposase IS4 family protein [Candidatus Brocadia pituitae]
MLCQGELNDNQRAGWVRAIDAVCGEKPTADSVSKNRFGCSRDKRSDCVQVVVALVLTPEGFPVAYEVYPGNTRDTATLGEFLDRIEKRYGKFRRTWLMDRGIPTEESLDKMREWGIDYLVGTPKGHLNRGERPLLEQARESVRVKILQQESELYVYVESQDRVAKECSMRHRRLKRLWTSLRELRKRKSITRDDLLMHIGALKKEAGRASDWSLSLFLNHRNRSMRIRSMSVWIVNACGEYTGMRGATCFVPTCRRPRQKPSGRIICC